MERNDKGVHFTTEEAQLLAVVLSLATDTCIVLEADKNAEEGYVEVKLLEALDRLEEVGITAEELDPRLKTT